MVGQGPAVLAAMRDENRLILGGILLTSTWFLPGNQTAIFWHFFRNIQCKFYLNNLYKHARSTKCIFLAFFIKFNFLAL